MTVDYRSDLGGAMKVRELIPELQKFLPETEVGLGGKGGPVRSTRFPLQLLCSRDVPECSGSESTEDERSLFNAGNGVTLC